MGPRNTGARHRRNGRTAVGDAAPVAWSSVPSRYDVTRHELGALLEGEPRFRVDQVWRGLYEQLAAPDDLTTLPHALGARLAAQLPAALDLVTEQVSGDGD